MSIAAERMAEAGAAERGARPALPGRRDRARARRRGWLIRRALISADIAGLAAAFLVAQVLFGLGEGGLSLRNVDIAVLLFVFSLPGWLVVAKLYKLYDHDEERTEHSTLDDLVNVLHLVTLGAWLFYVGTLVVRAPEPDLPKLAGFWALAVASITLARAAARAVCHRRPEYIQNTVVVGAGQVGQLVARKFRQHPEYGIRVLGFVDAEPRELREDLAGLRVLGAPERLPELVSELELDRVVIAFSADDHERSLALIGALHGLHVQIDIVPRLFEAVGTNVGVHSVEGLALVGLPTAKPFPFSRLLKRSVDVVGASIALVLAAPLFALAAWRIRRQSPGPVLFRQQRLGLGMREFTVLKFRTMRTDVDTSVHEEYIRRTMSATALVGANGLYKLDRDDAVTPFGRWLRRTSLDELPQLLNVLRGEMSLVGPRPCLAYETEHFAPHHFERFQVPAGMTGLWQVTARARATFGEALDLDVSYARGWSLGLDLWLLARTPFAVLRKAAV